MNGGRPESIEAYIAAASLDVQPILRKIRRSIKKSAPDAEETISYRMPAFRQNGILLYFAAFKYHIGIFPPIHGDEELDSLLQRYRGPKGNLKFPLDEPVPYALISRVAALRVAQDALKAGKGRKRER